ncbi:MAG: aldehyde dehydrogenase family protein [Nanoarchaeota archaeon]
MRNLVDGLWKDSISKRTFKSTNPSDTSDVVGTAPKSNRKDVEAAVESASEAFSSWKQLPWGLRTRYLIDLAHHTESKTEEIGDLLARETGKIRSEAHEDVRLAAEYVRSYATHHHRGDALSSHSTNRNITQQVSPIGVFAIIPSWNDPLLTLVRTLLGALAYGNTAVVKSSEHVPCTTARFVEIFSATGFPQGAVNLIHGADDVARSLMAHPLVRGVCHAGDERLGIDIAEYCARHAKNCYVENNRNGSTIICPDADIDAIMPDLLASCLHMSGQSNLSTPKILVHESVKDAFITKLRSAVDGLQLGPSLDSHSHIGPLIDEDHYKKLKETIATARKKDGADVLYEGMQVIKKPNLKTGFYHDVVILSVKAEASVLSQYLCGPVLCILGFEKTSQAIKIANTPESGMVTCVYTHDQSTIDEMRVSLESPCIHINTRSSDIEPQIPIRSAITGHYAGASTNSAHTFSSTRTIVSDYAKSGGPKNVP